MRERIKGSDYAQKLRSLLDKNKQIIKDLEDGKLTTQQASERVDKLSIEMKELTSSGPGKTVKSN